MREFIQYAYRIDADRETPCHISDIKRDDAFYLISGAEKSALFKATADAFSANVNGSLIWSVPHELYE